MKQLIGWRKFIIAASVILIATGVLIAHLIDGEIFSNLVKWVTGLYMAGNVTAKAAEMTAIKSTPTTDTGAKAK